MTFLRTLGALLVSLAGLALIAHPAAADGKGHRFSDRSIKGTWSLFVQGTTTDTTALPVAPNTDLVAVATVTFDGRGDCSSVDQIVVGGIYIPSREGFRDTSESGGSCVYEVNSDGTGYFDVVFPGAPVTNVTFVIVNKHEIRFIANNQGLGIFGGGELKRQR